MTEYYFETREEWRDWLIRNHKSAAEAWLVFYKKGSGKPGLLYNDSVEEALCFGWIDGKLKGVNKEYYILRFTVRKAGSKWSKYNIERVQKLIGLGKMQASGLEAYKKALEKPELIYGKRSDGDLKIPDDLLEAFSENKKACMNFLGLSESSRRIQIEWLKSAKRPETRMRRIMKIIDQSERNIRRGTI